MKVVALSCGVLLLSMLASAQIDINRQQQVMQDLLSDKAREDGAHAAGMYAGEMMPSPMKYIPQSMPNGVIIQSPARIVSPEDNQDHGDSGLADARILRSITNTPGELDTEANAEQSGDNDNTFQKLDGEGEVQSLTDLNHYPVANQDLNMNTNDAVGSMQNHLSKMYQTVAVQKKRLQQQKQALETLTNLVETNKKVYSANKNTTEAFNTNLDNMFKQYSEQMANATLLEGETLPPSNAQKSLLEESSHEFASKLERLKNMATGTAEEETTHSESTEKHESSFLEVAEESFKDKLHRLKHLVGMA